MWRDQTNRKRSKHIPPQQTNQTPQSMEAMKMEATRKRKWKRRRAKREERKREMRSVRGGVGYSTWMRKKEKKI